MRRRKRIRLKEYDYSLAGAYFVTICTKDRKHIFGEIIEGVMYSNDVGINAEYCWKDLTYRFSNIAIDEYVVMPNHIHGIIIINDDSCRGLINQTPTEKSWIMMENPKILLGKIIREYKARSSRLIRLMGVDTFEWQRNYYDHIIRNERSLYKIREYIRTNQERWMWDEENPSFQGPDEFDRWLKEEGKQKIKIQRIS